jgi:hypothetical protein
MPNDCYNYLEAPEGDLSLIADYFSTRKRKYSKLPDTYLNFEKILPIPKELENTDPNEDSLNWYNWCCENWGTKWNSYDGNVTEDGIGFNTAWAPPSPLIAVLANQIDKPLRMVYDEPGMDFCGEVLAYPDGTYEDNCYSPRSDAPDNLREELMIDDEDELDEDYE